MQVNKVTPACLNRGEDLPLLLSQLLASPYIDSGRANISVTSSGKQLFLLPEVSISIRWQASFYYSSPVLMNVELKTNDSLW